MAYDSGLAELMRQDLGQRDDLMERKMFGGLCFMLQGHMLCGVHKGGAMFRVGKPRMAQALALPGVKTMEFTKRPMGGFVDVSEQAMGDDTLRATLMALACENVASLPPK